MISKKFRQVICAASAAALVAGSFAPFAANVTAAEAATEVNMQLTQDVKSAKDSRNTYYKKKGSPLYYYKDRKIAGGKLKSDAPTRDTKELSKLSLNDLIDYLVEWKAK